VKPRRGKSEKRRNKDHALGADQRGGNTAVNTGTKIGPNWAIAATEVSPRAGNTETRSISSKAPTLADRRKQRGMFSVLGSHKDRQPLGDLAATGKGRDEDGAPWVGERRISPWCLRETNGGEPLAKTKKNAECGLKQMSMRGVKKSGVPPKMHTLIRRGNDRRRAVPGVESRMGTAVGVKKQRRLMVVTTEWE